MLTRVQMDFPLTPRRASTTLQFLHEDPQTPAADDVIAFEQALLGDSVDGHPIAIQSQWKRQLFALLERPESSYSAFTIHGNTNVYRVGKKYL
jgi:hypothetical protein